MNNKMIEENETEIASSNLPNVINMSKVKCSILEHGYNAIEMPFYFCNCDIDQKNPICIECSLICHKGHVLSKIKNNDPTKEKEKVLCECGMKCHQMDENVEKLDVYEPKCYFHEFSINSKINVYYVGPTSKICMFCFNFCNEKDENPFIRTIADSSETVPNCECRNELHHDVKSIYLKINLIFKEKANFENLYPAQIINLIYLSKKTFKNVFISFERYERKLEKSLNDPKFTFDENIHHSNYFNILLSIATISSHKNNFRYFSESVKNCFNIDLLYKILEKKFVSDISGHMNFRARFIDCVYRIRVGSDFCLCPDIKISDLENMSPWQRLIYSSNTNFSSNFNKVYFNDNNNNIIDKLIDGLNSLTKGRFTKLMGFESYFKLTNFLKKFAKFGFFNNNQKLRYCVSVEEFFSKNYDFKKKYVNNESDKMKMREYEIESFSGIIKTLIVFALNTNDLEVQKTVESNTDQYDDIKFTHSKNDLGRYIIKNCIILVNYVRSEIEYNKKDDDKINHLLELSTKLISLFFDNTDFYMVGLRRIFNINHQLYYNLLINNLTIEDQKFIRSIQDKFSKMESTLFEYFNFQQKLSNMEELLHNSVDDFFETVGGKYKIPEIIIKSSQKLKKVNKTLGNYKEGSHERYRVLMNKSYFIFTVVKYLDIFYNDIKEISIQIETENKLILKVLKLLYFFVEENEDNCIIGLSTAILSHLSASRGSNSDKILKYIYYCMNTLSLKKYEMSKSKKWLKYAHKVYNKSLDHDNKFCCINLYMKIMKIILLEIPSLNHNTLIKNIRENLKLFYNETSLIKDYKNYLKQQGIYKRNNPDHLNVKKNKTITTVVEIDKVGGCEIKLANKIFFKYLRLINVAFDDNAMYSDNEFLSQLMREEDILDILEDKTLDLKLRTELLRNFRMIYLDVTISQDKFSEYRSQFCKANETEIIGEGLIKHQDLIVLHFLENLMNISNTKFNTKYEYDLLINELKYLEVIFEQSKTSKVKHFLNYFEKGLILTLKIYLKKVFSICYKMKGGEFLDIYKLVIYILKMKEYLLKNENIVDEEKLDENIFKSIWKKPDLKNFIKKRFSKGMDEVKRDLLKMQSDSFHPLDYVAVYNIVNKQFFQFVSESKPELETERLSNSVTHVENEKKEQQIKLEDKGLLTTVYEKIIFKLLNIYELNKYRDYIISFLSEIHYDYGTNYRNLLLRFLFFFSKQFNTNVKIDENIAKNSHNLILKLLQFDTSVVQNEIQNIYDKSNEIDKSIFLKDLGLLLDYCFKNVISVIFSSYNPSTIKFHDDYYTSCILLKLFKFLCEGHNNFFQGLLMKKIELEFKYLNQLSQLEDKKVTFYNMILLILNKILLISNWDKVKDEEDNEISYFYELFNCLIDFLIEVVQGNITQNFSSLISKKKEKKINDKEDDDDSESIKALPLLLSTVKTILFKDNSNSNLLYKIRKSLCDYLLAFLEEKKCPPEIKKLIISTFYPQSILESIIKTMKKLYNKCEIDHEEEDRSLEIKDSMKEIDFLQGAFKREEKEKKHSKTNKNKKFKDIYHYFKDKYYQDEELSKSSEFEFANTLYRYLKLLALEYENEEALQIINKVKETEANENLENNGNKILPDGKGSNKELNETQLERNNAVKFFEDITRTISIQYDNDKTPTRVIFTINYKCVTLSNTTKEKFLLEVDRNSRYTKLIGLIENNEGFYEEINYNYEILKKSLFMRYAIKINYQYVEFIAFLNALALNLLLLFGLDLHNLHGELNIKPYIIWLNLQQILFNLIFFIIWMYSKFPLYYQIDKKKYIEKKDIKENEEVGFFTDLFIIKLGNTIINRNEVLMLAWNTFCGLIGFILFSKNNFFIFAIQLISITNLSHTLRNILVALKMRFLQLMNTMLLFVVILYMFAVLGYFFFPNDFYIWIGHKEASKIKEPACTTLLNCLVTMINEGLRIRPGVGEFMFHKSFIYERSHYMASWIYKLSFFIIVVVIMLNMVFGIIIDTFRELRKKAAVVELDIANICFICGAKKNELEKSNINYENHVSDEHYIWNYVYYMVVLTGIPDIEANAVTSYAKEKIKKKEISWFPNCDKKNEEMEEKEEHEEKKNEHKTIENEDKLNKKLNHH